MEVISLCHEADSAASDLLESACKMKDLIAKRIEMLHKEEEERKKLEKSVKREAKWAQTLAKSAATADIDFYVSSLTILWELSISPSNCKKIISIDGVIESIISFIEEEIDEKGRTACYGILCNICASKEARYDLIENYSDLITKAVVLGKNEIEISEEFDQKEKQIISFINNLSLDNDMKNIIIKAGFMETFASSIERFITPDATDVIVQCCNSIIATEEGTPKLSIPSDEIQLLQSSIMKNATKTSGMISLLSTLMTMQ